MFRFHKQISTLPTCILFLSWQQSLHNLSEEMICLHVIESSRGHVVPRVRSELFSLEWSGGVRCDVPVSQCASAAAFNPPTGLRVRHLLTAEYQERSFDRRVQLVSRCLLLSPRDVRARHSRRPLQKVTLMSWLGCRGLVSEASSALARSLWWTAATSVKSNRGGRRDPGGRHVSCAADTSPHERGGHWRRWAASVYPHTS